MHCNMLKIQNGVAIVEKLNCIYIHKAPIANIKTKNFDSTVEGNRGRESGRITAGGGREAGGGGTQMRESCENGRQEKNEGH